MTKLLTYQDLKSRGIDMTKVGLWRLERADEFPRRVRISHKRIAWVEDEIDAWLQDKMDARKS